MDENKQKEMFDAFSNILSTKTEKSISDLIDQGFYFPSLISTKEDKIAFAKARLEYFQYIFEQEIKTRENLEKKIQFYLSFITILLGAIFLKFSSLKVLNDMIHHNQISTLILAAIWISIIGIGVSLIVALIFIIMVVSINKVPGLYSKEVVQDWFGKDSWFNSEERVINSRALMYAVILKKYLQINQQKAQCATIASYSIIGVVVFSSIFIGLVVYLSMKVENYA